MVDVVILRAQRSELTPHLIYTQFAEEAKDPENKKILERVAADEMNHYNFWKSITKQDVKPNKFALYWYLFIAHFFD